MLLDPDGGSVLASPLKLSTATVATGSMLGPWIAWTGTQYVVAWIGATGLQIVGLDASGAPNGLTAVVPPTNVAYDTSMWSADFIYAPSQGFAFVYSSGAGVTFRRLGMNASAPESPVRLDTYPVRADLTLGAAPSGEWGVYFSAGKDALARLNPDGSHTISDVVPFPSFSTSGRPLGLAFDGTSWMVAWSDSDPYNTREYVSRGVALNSRFLIYQDAKASTVNANPQFPAARLRYANGVLDALFGYEDGSGYVGVIKLQRYSVPGLATSAPVPLLAAPLTILATQNSASHDSPPDFAYTATRRAFVVWGDTRWGDAEIYGAAVDFLGCP